MTELVGFGLVAAILVVAIASIVLTFYYGPTVERANRGGAGPAEPVHGWRRVVALDRHNAHRGRGSTVCCNQVAPAQTRLATRSSFELLADPGKPIARFTTVVRKRQNPNSTLPRQVHNVVGEALHRNFADGQFARQACDSATDLRPRRDLFQRGVNGLNELQAKSRALALVPKGGVFKFGGGFGFRAERTGHRSVNRWTTRARTSSHGSPTDSPFITRRARRSISCAHAASTSAAFSAGSSSRLASNSAATSARSLTGNVKASRRSSCARDVM